MSRAWYKPGVGPKLLRSFQRERRSVEVWNATCIVTAFKEADCNILINPGNPQLSGVSKFPYFPRGGPAPKEYPKKDAHHIMGFVSQWGGMEVGDGLLFSANVVDGLVHQWGGWKLRWEISFLPILDKTNEEKCPVGYAVHTASGGQELERQYASGVVHTVPPFYKHHFEPEIDLLRCYEHSFELAFQKTSRVACPLLGAGARGFPLDVAIDIASQACTQWLNQQEIATSNDQNFSLAFAIPDIEIAEALLYALHLRVADTEIQRSPPFSTETICHK